MEDQVSVLITLAARALAGDSLPRRDAEMRYAPQRQTHCPFDLTAPGFCDTHRVLVEADIVVCVVRRRVEVDDIEGGDQCGT